MGPVGAPRKRGRVLEEAILRATAEELVESGFHGLTMDRVAARAGTNKNAIYRRWPDRPTLAVAAYRHLLPTEPSELPDTGEVRGDALALLGRANERMASPVGAVLRAVLAGIPHDASVRRELRDQVVEAGNAAWLTVLARAVARGELREGALRPRVATVAVDLLRQEYALAGPEPVAPSVLTAIVDEVFLPLVRAL